MLKTLISIMLLTSCFTAVAQDSPLKDAITAAMEAELRTDAERERDRNRRPVQTLEFFGLQPNMKVLELIPGAGWYTKLLAPTLRDSGELHVALATGRVKERLLDKPGFDKLNVIEIEAQIERTEQRGVNTIGEFSVGEIGFDAALTFRNMHNFDAAGRNNINMAVFNALKSGGIYGVVDHTRRHMEADTSENRRRADPVLIIKELLDLGFEFVDYSDLHFKPDDELRYEVGRKSVTGNTDRFTLLFRKP